MTFPVSSRMTVQRSTWICLTSVFGMRTGEPDRYGRPTTSVKRRLHRAFQAVEDCAESAQLMRARKACGTCALHTQPFGSRKPKPVGLSFGHTVMSVWTVRKGGLNTSLPRCVHPPPIKPVFYGRPTSPRLDAGFTLRCFQRLSLTAWLPSGALSDNW